MGACGQDAAGEQRLDPAGIVAAHVAAVAAVMAFVLASTQAVLPLFRWIAAN